jgi:hypothetical protein
MRDSKIAVYDHEHDHDRIDVNAPAIEDVAVDVHVDGVGFD